jgi:superfamily I DNA/RNA helicase
MILPDSAARASALTDIDRSLLVEAGAGSGKTAILAGRIAFLLASGVAPKHIAAITFTEFAASELLIRVDKFVRGLTNGGKPAPELAAAFPQGVSEAQRQNLAVAVTRLGGHCLEADSACRRPHVLRACLFPSRGHRVAV